MRGLLERTEPEIVALRVLVGPYSSGPHPVSSCKKIGPNRVNHDVKTEKSPIPRTFRLLFNLDMRYSGTDAAGIVKERW